MVIWIIGMSGAGKTTVGRAVHRLWRESEPHTVLVDGDEVRRIFRQDQTKDAYAPAGRAANAERIRELCAWLDRQEINVVCCILSIFEESHQWNRAHYSRYFEVFLSVPLDVLVARDTKGLYQPALRGESRNVVGVDIAFQPPAAPDLVIDNSQPGLDADAVARLILARAPQLVIA
jgi:cytidine diphosphoramidate kinase